MVKHSARDKKGLLFAQHRLLYYIISLKFTPTPNFELLLPNQLSFIPNTMGREIMGLIKNPPGSPTSTFHLK